MVAEGPAKWLAVLEDVERRIRSGDLRPGEQLPSLAEQKLKGYSNTTTLRAYRHLMGAGLVTSASGVGYFVASTPPPNEPSLADRVARLEADVAEIKGRLP